MGEGVSRCVPQDVMRLVVLRFVLGEFLEEVVQAAVPDQLADQFHSAQQSLEQREAEPGGLVRVQHRLEIAEQVLIDQPSEFCELGGGRRLWLLLFHGSTGGSTPRAQPALLAHLTRSTMRFSLG